MKIKLFMVMVLMAALPGCGIVFINSDTLKVSKNFGVWLEPKPAQNTIKIKTKAQGWKKKNKKDGYVGYAQGDSGVTFFGIDRRNLGGSCEAGTADWVISQLRLSASGDEAEEKGTGFGSGQPGWLKEAFPNVDLSNGVLYEAIATKGITFLPVYNANAQEGFRFIYYEVTLTNCEDSSTLTTDPGWGNGGHN
jgi:hypothetical protein